jgi:putative endonuclease
MSFLDIFRKKPLTVGSRGEHEAARLFKKNGYKIREMNYRSSHYEIDFIAENRDFIVFVEVKSRCCTSPDDMPYGTRPVFAVTRDKQKFILYAAKAYMRSHPEIKKQPRLDVVEVFFDNTPTIKNKKILKINHIPNAFGE